MDVFVKHIFSFLSLTGIEIHIVFKFRNENHSLYLNLKTLKEVILKINYGRRFKILVMVIIMNC